MTTADPTMDLIDSLNRADPGEWGRIIYGAPIFCEHSGYEVTDGKEKRLVVVPAGEEPPEGAKLLYSVDEKRLELITKEIARNYAEGTPIKLFIGHSDPKKPQEQNPPLAGFGRGARMGTFGPQKRKAILTDAFFKPGFENAATEYPERSPEFVLRTNGITGVALLKTDPRLKMGMLAYSADREGIIYYGVGFMADEIVDNADDEKKPPMPAPKPGEKRPAKAGEEEADEVDANEGEKSPAVKPSPFQPHEIAFADRLMAHLEQNHPAIKHLCGEHKKHVETQAAMAAPKQPTAPTAPGTPPETPKKKPDAPERIDMSQTAEERINYAEERIAKLEEENAILYATEAITTLEREGIQFKNRDKEITKLVKMKTAEERQEYISDIRLNYARTERSPAQRGGFLPLDTGHVEGGTEGIIEPSAADVISYAEEHNIDASTEAGMQKIIAGLMKKSA